MTLRDMKVFQGIDKQVRTWFASDKGKRITSVAGLLVIGEILGFESSISDLVKIVAIIPFIYLAVFLADKYGNKEEKPPEVVLLVA